MLTAYGWADLIPALVGKPGGTIPLPDQPSEQAAAEEELLTRLIALNAERAAEEARGLVRWLCPEFQNPDGNRADGDGATIETETIDLVQPSASKRPWPKTLPEQFQALRELLAAQPSLASPEQIARCFARAPTKKVAELIDTLAALGQIQQFAPSGDGNDQPVTDRRGAPAS